MVVLPSLPTLARTAAIGGFIVIGSAHYFRGRIQDGIKQSEYYQESLRIVRENRGVAHLMGEPIRDGRLDLGDNINNFCTGKEAQFQVPLKGTKQTGILYLWASRSDSIQPWCVDRLELSVEDQPGKRILLRKEHTSAEKQTFLDVSSVDPIGSHTDHHQP
uniref:Cytochrome oxidase complex assembly protein 1 n=1 Tax=Scylla olivacea TaxID=85551 RepID=A0A0P4X256_SCYOL